MLWRVRDGRHSSRNCSAPAPLAPVGAQPEEQRRIRAARATSGSSRGASGFAHGSAYDAEIWPPLANDVSSAAPRLAVDDRHLVAVAREIPRGGDADDAAAEDEDAHHQAAARRRTASFRRRRPPPGCSCRTGCGRRRRCRRAPTGGQYFALAAATRTGYAACSRANTRASSRRRRRPRAVCGACFSGLSARSERPSSIARISSRIAIIASMKRSSSAFDSLSVGSTISVPGDREAHRRRVEAVVDQALGDVLRPRCPPSPSAGAGRGCTRARRGRPARCRAPDSAARDASRRSSPRGSPLSVAAREAARRPSSRCTSTRSAGSTREPYGARRRPAPIAVPRAGASTRARGMKCRWPGRNGARCACTATGPTPGPPPPCGMQNVLCRFRCETSAPKSPGRREPDQRVQVRAVDVHLAAVRVHDVADVARCRPRTRRASTDT